MLLGHSLLKQEQHPLVSLPTVFWSFIFHPVDQHIKYNYLHERF